MFTLVISFFAGAVVTQVGFYLWARRVRKKRERHVNAILSSYDGLANRYFADYQNREQAGSSAEMHH